MDTLIKDLSENKTDKIQKPNFDTRVGREFLAFYLKTKFRQVVNYDKKAEPRLFLTIKDDFLDRFLDRLINNPSRKILISITGESASGKSTICNKISESVEKQNLPISIMNTDNYFNDISELISKYGTFDNLRDSGYDVDSPENFQLDLLRDDIENLACGEDILAPQYLVNGTGVSVPKSIKVKSNKIIVVEGMAATYSQVQNLFDIKVYVDLDNKIRKKRFLNRAQVRNQDQDNALKHWEYVCNAGKKYVIPSKDNCDIIINGQCDLDYFTQILTYINIVTNNFQEV